MKKPFSQSSYLSQVRSLRKLGTQVLREYPIKVKTIEFINHGENTTFKIKDKAGESYLLRIHRNDYHTKAAIIEEMKWLSHLTKKGLSVPNPVFSKNGNLVETTTLSEIQETRNCSVFKWIHGTFIDKSVKPKHLFAIGQLLADFQSNTPKGKTKARQYWTAEGLLGTAPKFGSIDNLAAANSRQQSEITKARKKVFAKLVQFQKKYPERMGLIHADLHFGNVVSTGKGIGAIDFDDGGFGFHAYDLVIPYISVQHALGKKRKHLLQTYKNALINGYKSKRNWDPEDEKIFEELVKARKLLMLGWLNSRSDNPKLKSYLKKSIKNVLGYLRTLK